MNLQFDVFKRYPSNWVYSLIYLCFFLSGFTSLIFEVLWSRQFVTVFGNSSYAISIVLCAYMAGIGMGGLYGGKLADRTKNHAVVFGSVQVLIALWAFLIPMILDWLKSIVTTLSILSPESLLISTFARFGLSIAILGIPCFLMGTTLPVLVKMVTDSVSKIGKHIGILYSINTFGAAMGCLAAGFWMIETLGLHNTNLTAIIINMIIAILIFSISKKIASLKIDEQFIKETPIAEISHDNEYFAPSKLLLLIAFFNGFVGLACEVIWIRYIDFVDNVAYVFPTILFIFLLGTGLGGLIFGLWSDKIRKIVKALGLVEVLIAIIVPFTFITTALIFSKGPPRPMELLGLTIYTVFIPTVLMGIAFPMLCTAYVRNLKVLGSRVGLLFSINTLGTVIGSLLPMFVLIPLFGIQLSLLLISIIYGILGLSLLFLKNIKSKPLAVKTGVMYALILLAIFIVIPSDLCKRFFLATSIELSKHNEILFYKEGRTGTSIVVHDKINNCKSVYINGVSEVPVMYGHNICFKMLGDLAPLMHPNPDSILMVCFGGGIAAGATASIPEVKSLTVVDLESSIIESAKLLTADNNGLLNNPKVHIAIDDGRNYLMMSHRDWPIIITDATHPKSSDSWVLYTRDFYKLVNEHLTKNGIFVEWVPFQNMRMEEFKIILRTFQSVFPHSSLWITIGTDEQGRLVAYSLVIGTIQPLMIDLAQISEKLKSESLRNDLRPYGLDTPTSMLSAFICSEKNLRIWVGNGLINTDNLPYTQYDNPYSKNRLLSVTEFIEPMESIWPYISKSSKTKDSITLKDDLALNSKINRWTMLGFVKEAFSLRKNDAHYKKMLQLYDDGSTYIQKMSQVYWNNPIDLVYIIEKTNGNSKNYEIIEKIYKRILTLDPENASALNYMGVKMLNEGRLKEAEDILQTAVKNSHGYAGAFYNLGLVMDRTNRHDEAIRLWEKAAKDPRFEDAPITLGICSAKKGDIDEAIKWFRRSVEIDPVSVESRIYLSKALIQKGIIPEALKNINFVFRLDPGNTFAQQLTDEIKNKK